MHVGGFWNCRAAASSFSYLPAWTHVCQVLARRKQACRSDYMVSCAVSLVLGSDLYFVTVNWSRRGWVGVWMIRE